MGFTVIVLAELQILPDSNLNFLPERAAAYCKRLCLPEMSALAVPWLQFYALTSSKRMRNLTL